MLDIHREISRVETAADLHHAAGAVDRNGVGSGFLDVFDLLGQDRRRDLRELDAVCAAEAAAYIAFLHLGQMDAP